MAFDPVEELLNRLTARGGAWPPRDFRPAWDSIRRWRAFLETDREQLRQIAGWEETGRPYKADPLPDRIAWAWADHLFGEDITVIPGSDNDGQLLTDLLEGNELSEELRTAERSNVGEGEIWWRIGVDEEVADVPLIEWHSRDVVAPLFIGRRLVAAALITVLDGPGARDGNSRPVYRHFEIHVNGQVVHRLYRGTKGRIGEEVDLERHPETEDLEPVWAHGLPMLMGRIVNRRGRRIDLGVSDFHPIKDFLLELNEALTIGGENMRLTAKKRAIVDESVIQDAPAIPDSYDRGDGVRVPYTDTGDLQGQVTRPRFRAGDDLLVRSKLDSDLGGGADNVFKVLEYSYDAEALIAHKRDLVESALTRIGLTPQWVGAVTGSGDGLALSGTALRLRLIPTDKAGRGKARPWDETLPWLLQLAARVDSLSLEDGGFGRVWADLDTLPAVERANPLPNDPVEDAQVEQALVGARVRSRRTSIKAQHPDWTDEQVETELEQISEEQPSPSSFGF